MGINSSDMMGDMTDALGAQRDAFRAQLIKELDLMSGMNTQQEKLIEKRAQLATNTSLSLEERKSQNSKLLKQEIEIGANQELAHHLLEQYLDNQIGIADIEKHRAQLGDQFIDQLQVAKEETDKLYGSQSKWMAKAQQNLSSVQEIFNEIAVALPAVVAVVAAAETQMDMLDTVVVRTAKDYDMLHSVMTDTMITQGLSQDTALGLSQAFSETSVGLQLSKQGLLDLNREASNAIKLFDLSGDEAGQLVTQLLRMGMNVDAVHSLNKSLFETGAAVGLSRQEMKILYPAIVNMAKAAGVVGAKALEKLTDNVTQAAGHFKGLGLSAEDALSQLDRDTPSLIFVDLNMPTMSGTEFTKQIREAYPQSDLPIILVTTQTDAHEDEEVLEGLFNQIIQKPFTIDELTTVANNFL